MFETQKSVNRTSNDRIGINIRTHAGPKVGQDQVPGDVSILYCVIAVSYWLRKQLYICGLKHYIYVQR